LFIKSKAGNNSDRNNKTGIINLEFTWGVFKHHEEYLFYFAKPTHPHTLAQNKVPILHKVIASIRFKNKAGTATNPIYKIAA
jgi:hypothetical protein